MENNPERVVLIHLLNDIDRAGAGIVELLNC
jgi:hypothetical protein